VCVRACVCVYVCVCVCVHVCVQQQELHKAVGGWFILYLLHACV